MARKKPRRAFPLETPPKTRNRATRTTRAATYTLSKRILCRNSYAILLSYRHAPAPAFPPSGLSGSSRVSGATFSPPSAPPGNRLLSFPFPNPTNVSYSPRASTTAYGPGYPFSATMGDSITT